MSSIANPLTSGTPAGITPPSTTKASSSTDPLANESTFLTLLVSQLQNQDPLSPTDSNQFVSQLTSYSQLEQLIGIHSNTTTLAGNTAATPAATAPTGTTPTSNTGANL
ncbi:MAG TPA: flagellar hook capping FlgD N-terminal domain-containing protein [Bryobacteraceae bacterium]|nr:flagellar hook capping FlgD N-terminal domain-containing protein [Bryobacteraceae bacterium]